MKKLTIIAVVLLCVLSTSCSNKTIAEEDTLYETQATEGDDEHGKETRTDD